MPTENDLYDLMNQFEEDMVHAYDSFEFHEKAVRVLSEHGYSLEEENILEIHESDPYEVDQYLEVIGKFEDTEGIPTYLKFVLEDSRDNTSEAAIEFAADLEDTTDLERKNVI